MTSDRPYRRAMSWAAAGPRAAGAGGRQFDPAVVDAFCSRERTLRRIRRELADAALVASVDEVGGGGAVLEPVWCQSAIFPLTMRKIAVARLPGPSQRLCCRSPSTKVAGGLAVARDRDDLPRARQRGVPGHGLRVGAKPEDARALDDLAPGAKRSAAPLLSSAFSAWLQARTTLWVDGGLCRSQRQHCGGAPSSSKGFRRGPLARAPGSAPAAARSRASGDLRRAARTERRPAPTPRARGPRARPGRRRRAAPRPPRR